MKYRRFFYLLIMLLLAAIAIYTFYKAKQSSRYPDIYSEKTDGPDYLSFTLTDGITDYPAFAIVNNLVLVNVPNQGDYSHLRATFQHNGKEVFVNGVIQKSGENENDFSDPTKPVVYTLVSSEGKSRNYYIELFDIPVVRINTYPRIYQEAECFLDCHNSYVSSDARQSCNREARRCRSC